MRQFFIILCVLFLIPSAAFAAETQPGDACTTSGQIRNTGGAGETSRLLQCDGTIWIAAEERSATGKTSLQVDNDTGSCTSVKLGRLRYNGTATWEYCNGTTWTALGGGSGSTGFLYRH